MCQASALFRNHFNGQRQGLWRAFPLAAHNLWTCTWWLFIWRFHSVNSRVVFKSKRSIITACNPSLKWHNIQQCLISLWTTTDCRLTIILGTSFDIYSMSSVCYLQMVSSCSLCLSYLEGASYKNCLSWLRIIFFAIRTCQPEKSVKKEQYNSVSKLQCVRLVWKAQEWKCFPLEVHC